MNTQEKVSASPEIEHLRAVEKQLKEYILNNYDINNDGIALKFTHTFRTKLVSDEICLNLNLSDRQIYLAGIIALFHDFARFEQFKTYNSFNDMATFDHGDKAVEMLFDNNQIKEFVNDLTDEEYLIVKLAIKNHNKLNLEDGLTKTQKLFCKIIRDADKVDIFRIIAFDPRCDGVKIGYLKQEDLDNFYNNKLFKKKEEHNFYDLALINISYLFDLNFDCSCTILQTEKYVKMYMYSLLLWANFKVDEDLIACFEYADKYIASRVNKQ